jgi:phosphoglycolate phosphatase
MPYSLIIFDLDGTLADSFPWFRRHVNDVADRFKFRRVTEDDIETLRHSGSREILAHLEVPRWKLPWIARHMRRLTRLPAWVIDFLLGRATEDG